MNQIVVTACILGLLLLGCSESRVTSPLGEDIGTGTTTGPPSGDAPAPPADLGWAPADEDVEGSGPGTCPPGGGCFGDPCDENLDCWSGLCATHLGNGACTKTCEEDCPEGWSCKQVLVGGGDPIYICVSDAASLCRPCGTASDCEVNGVEDACVVYGETGSFCGANCGDDQACPDGFNCAQSETTGGGTSAQCVPIAGECTCSETAVQLGLTTACSVTNVHGSCPGVRACSASGLTNCDAQVPAYDGCDDVDNDCDGETDEGCAYRISGFLLGDGAGAQTGQSMSATGALGAPRFIGVSTNTTWTVRSGLVFPEGE